MSDSIKKALIFRLSSIGDVVLTTPFLRALHKRFPDAEIDFVIRNECADVLRYHPYISTLHEIDVSLGKNELLRLRNYFQEQQYDCVFDLHNNFRTKFMRAGLKAPTYVIDKRTFQRWLLIKTKINLFQQIIPVAERYIETAASFGIKPDNDGPEIFIPQNILDSVWKKVGHHLGDNRNAIIALCPGSKHFTKRWPVEYFSALAKRIVTDMNYSIIILGGTEDRYLAEVIERSVGNQIYNACDEFSILETAATIDLCSGVITNDSGLMHIACARKRPIISIFGSTVKEFGFYPYHSDAKILEVDGLRCRPCSHIGRDFCPKQHFKCMKEISPDAVFEEFLELVNH